MSRNDTDNRPVQPVLRDLSRPHHVDAVSERPAIRASYRSERLLREQKDDILRA